MVSLNEIHAFPQRSMPLRRKTREMCCTTLTKRPTLGFCTPILRSTWRRTLRSTACHAARSRAALWWMSAIYWPDFPTFTYPAPISRPRWGRQKYKFFVHPCEVVRQCPVLQFQSTRSWWPVGPGVFVDGLVVFSECHKNAFQITVCVALVASVLICGSTL